MQNAFEQEQAHYRKLIPYVRSEDLLKCLESTYRLLGGRQVTAGFGIHDDDPRIEQQYRLTAFALEQELLKRLHVS